MSMYRIQIIKDIKVKSMSLHILETTKDTSIIGIRLNRLKVRGIIWGRGGETYAFATV